MAVTKFEHFSQPLISTQYFVLRMLRHGGLVLLFLALSMAMGIIGYHAFANLSWIDAYLNASMDYRGETVRVLNKNFENEEVILFAKTMI